MNDSISVPEQGQIVKVRQRRYSVVEVAQSTLPFDILKPVTPNLAFHKSSVGQTQHLVTLASVEDDALGEELQIVWEIEPGAEIIEESLLPTPTDFDPPYRLDAFLNAVRWGAASSADVKSLQAPFRSGIDIEDYQLDPVARAITMPRVNLLIADDVGLGKTIEAGLVLQELIIRHRTRKVLVVCPAALQLQWRDQMRDKFGLEFRIVDSELMKTLRRKRGLHVNPWTHFPRLITSIDFLKRERPMRLMTETLPSEGESTYPRRFDMLIVDEAHNIAPAGQGQQYATDSQRTLAIRRLAPHFEHKLFLSATPHNGFQESFTTLLELLDNQRFARGVRPDRDQLKAVMIRRLKSELPPRWDGTSRFPKRELEAIEVNYSQTEREVHRLLQTYSQSRIKGAADDGVERYASEFVLKLLKKRLFSSPRAFVLTLEKHLNSLENAKRRTSTSANLRANVGILRRQIEQVEETETDDDEALDEAVQTALDAAAPLFRQPNQQEQLWLDQMHGWAEKASRTLDNKAQRLVEWLRRYIKPNNRWSDERVIIFTEYRDTQKWLHEMLYSADLADADRLMMLSGGMDDESREKIKAAFQADPRESKVRILLATDAASEGIDLQNYCSRLIHYEIPWNPNRLEQRNGRIDRHGQRADAVQIYHFVSSLYAKRVDDDLPVGELEADLEFIWRAAQKVNRIREDLGKVGPVIAQQVEEAMLGKRHRLDTASSESSASEVRALLKFERDLKRDIDRLYGQLQASQRELQLTPENVQAVVEIALELAGQPPLVKKILHDLHGEKPDIKVFELPQLSGSWATAADGLLHPHTNQRRPIVFNAEDAKGRDDVVLAHLNHRLVTMSLRLLRAEVWSAQPSLHRVAARVIPALVSEEPLVIAHARLLLIGGDSQRLHEEVILAGGRLKGGKFERMEYSDLVKALESVRPQQAVMPSFQKRLGELWPTHQAGLLRALEVARDERFKRLQKQLNDRATKEIKDITAILNELRTTILQKLNEPEFRQLQLTGFSTAEQEQFERNKSALHSRVAQIPTEIELEVATIRKRFADPAARFFPVAVTYLVPDKLNH